MRFGPWLMELMAWRAEHYGAELERHRVNDAEEYNILKIRLETDVQNLEQHLEVAPARRWSVATSWDSI